MRRLLFSLWIVILLVGTVLFIYSCDKVSDLHHNENSGEQPPGDNQPPDTIINSGNVTGNSATFTWMGTDDNDQPSQLVFSYKMDNSSWSGFSGNTFASFQDLAQGKHVFKVKARDTEGLEDPTPAMMEFTVSGSGDPPSSAPDTEIIQGPPANHTSDTAFFKWTGYDKEDSPGDLVFSYKLDNNSWSGFDYWTTVNIVGLTNGSHVFLVKAKDTDGNEDPTPAQWLFNVNLDTRGVKLSATNTNLEIPPGDFGVFDCTITNTGTIADQFRVTLDKSSLPPDWIASLCKDGVCYADNMIDFDLAGGASDNFEPDISPAFTASPGESGSITLHAQSLTDPSVTDTMVLTVTVP